MVTSEMSRFRITFGILVLHLYHVRAQFADNTPPTVVLERHWMIPDTEPNGSVVVKVNAQDAEGDPLEFGLEKPDGSSNFNLYFNSSSRDLPFRIDSHGVVYTNDSLAERGGEKLFLYVTVFDGQLTHKSEVYVNILNSKNPQDLGQSQSPRIPSNIGPNFHLPNRFPPPPLGGNFPRLPGFPNQQPFPVNFPNPNPNPVLTTNRTLLKAKETGVSSSTTALPSTTETPTTHAPTSTSSEQSSKSKEPRKTADVTPTPVDGKDPDIFKNLALTIVPLVIVCTAFLVSAISACIFRKRICKARKKSKKGDKDKEFNASSNRIEEPMAMTHWLGPRAYTNRYEAWETDANQLNGALPTVPVKLDPWEYPRHHLKVFSILGEGCFGQVWKCEAMAIGGREGPSTVAVKTLKENAGEQERLDLIQELKVMKSLAPHPNVVRLLGCCTEKDPLFVIMEYITYGKLQSFLRDSRAQRNYDNMHARSATLTSRDLTSFCYQVARGMEFLSGKGIIHRDLAARNVLVGENQICKVADFGFARDLVTSHVYERKSEGRLPIRWMAPESLYDNLFSVKSDIWSFGVLIWEIVTLGSTPYPGIGAAEVMRKVRDGYRLDKPEHCRRELYNIMYYCWDQVPAERPNFTELVTLLEQLLLSETDYIQLDQFPDHSYYNILSLSGEKL